MGCIMGISFSVTYATIFIMWLETPIIKEFPAHILLYKRVLDEIFIMVRLVCRAVLTLGQI